MRCPAILLSILVLGAVGAESSVAATRNVPADFPTIQQALDASGVGDVVLVAPGSYVGAITLSSRHEGVRLASSAGPDVTIIDGGRSGSTIRCGGVGPATVIEGFTITGGGEVPHTVTIGGGIRIDGASPTIRGNTIRGNTSVAAGGIYVDGGAPVIVANLIADNEAPGGSGGGIYCDHDARPRIQDNVIVGNSCAAYGGGVTVWEGSAPAITGNTIASNRGSLGGGGIYVTRDSHPVVTRTIVAFNTVGSGVVQQDPLSSVALGCSDVFGNLPADFVGLADPAGSNGDQSTDPLFCDLAGSDLHLSVFSPCAAANSPSGCQRVGALDPACTPTPTVRGTWGGLKAKYAAPAQGK